MIKFTIILVAIYILLRGGSKFYIDSLSILDKLRISLKEYTKLESILFLLFGLLHILMWICIVISGVMMAFQYL